MENRPPKSNDWCHHAEVIFRPDLGRGRYRVKIKGKRMNFAFSFILLPFLCT
jgi:hypothetical protein